MSTDDATPLALQLDPFSKAVMALAREITSAPLTTGQAMLMLALLQDINAAHANQAVTIVDLMATADDNGNQPRGGGHP